MRQLMEDRAHTRPADRRPGRRLGAGFALNIISTAFSLLLPLALVAIGGFAFYKIVLEGRDSGEVMEDEVAESAGVAMRLAARRPLKTDADTDDGDDSEARQRLSAVERAQSEFFDTATPAEEILDQIQSRKRRLTGKDDA